MQGAECIRGGRRINLPGILVEEVEGVVEALLLAGLHGALGDIPNTQAVIQSIDRSPVETKRDVALIQRPRPGLIHFAYRKHWNSFGIDQFAVLVVIRGTLSSQMMSAREGSPFYAIASGDIVFHPIRRRVASCLIVPRLLLLPFPFFIGVFFANAVEKQGDFRFDLVEELRIQGEGL